MTFLPKQDCNPSSFAFWAESATFSKRPKQIKAVSLEDSTCKRTPEDMFKSAVMLKPCSKEKLVCTNGLQNSHYSKSLLCSSAILRLLTDDDRMRSFSVTMAYVFAEFV